MRSVAEQVKLNLQPLVGLKLSRMALAADMRTIQFGNTERRSSGGVVGEYALHIQCPWRLETDKGLVTGSDDLNVPYELGDQPEGSFDRHTGDSLQERVLRDLLNGFDEDTKQIVNLTNLLVVEAVEADSCGGFILKLSGGYRFVIFPDGRRREAWRLFKPSKNGHKSDQTHFVVPFES